MSQQKRGLFKFERKDYNKSKTVINSIQHQSSIKLLFDDSIFDKRLNQNPFQLKFILVCLRQQE